jgi:hypothetical protein
MDRIKCPKCAEKGEEMYFVKDFFLPRYPVIDKDFGKVWYESSEYEPYETLGEHYCESCGFSMSGGKFEELVESLRKEQNNE